MWREREWTEDEKEENFSFLISFFFPSLFILFLSLYLSFFFVLSFYVSSAACSSHLTADCLNYGLVIKSSSSPG